MPVCVYTCVATDDEWKRMESGIIAKEGLCMFVWQRARESEQGERVRWSVDNKSHLA